MAVAEPATRTETMVGFGGKQAWLAVRGGEPSAPDGSLRELRQLVGARLGLRDLGPVSWRTGIDLAYFTDDRVAFTPALPGIADSRWLLVVGRWLALDLSIVDIEDLSESLGTDVQYFATDRSTQRHRWYRAHDGLLLRSFDFLGSNGKVLDWRGEPDAAERDVGLPTTVDEEADVLVGESDVFRVAAGWSLDPTMLDGRPAPGPLHAAAPA